MNQLCRSTVITHLAVAHEMQWCGARLFIPTPSEGTVCRSSRQASVLPASFSWGLWDHGQCLLRARV